VRTQVTLDAIGPLVGGYHDNPFGVLGPHLIEENGRSAVAVRAFLPDTQQVWLVDKSHGTSRMMRKIHPAGLYEAICDESGVDCTTLPASCH
jgi:1,4-alpha-glucan branching enzyme